MGAIFAALASPLAPVFSAVVAGAVPALVSYVQGVEPSVIASLFSGALGGFLHMLPSPVKPAA